MVTKLAYGKRGLFLDLKDVYNVDIIEPGFTPPLINPLEIIQKSLREPIGCNPLKQQVSACDTVGIVLSDITRPVPTKRILPVILDEISHVKPENITLFIGLGTHRPNTGDELREMVGNDIFNNYRFIQNDAFNKATQKSYGFTSNKNEIYINKELAFCDFIILTGFIEPHFFAGFSGGSKAIMPGMAGINTILKNHSPKMIANPNSVFGITTNNPIWEEITEIGRVFEKSFLINVSLNKDKEITGVFSGDLFHAHSAGCSFVKNLSLVPVKQAYDIVITTNSGYPLDINLYQSIKGMSSAARIVKTGGTIIIAAECREGIPEHGCYGTLLGKFNNPQDLIDYIMSTNEIVPDQWQAQIQAQILMNSEVHIFSDFLSDAEIRSALLKPCKNIENLVSDLVQKNGQGTRICILPEGPQTIPFLE